MGLKEPGLRGSLRNVSVGIDAIPDSVIHHYDPINFTTSQWPDEVGTSDMDAISGLSEDSSAFDDNGGVSADGTDHGLTDTMGDFGQNRDTDFAISVPFNTTDNDAMLLGHDEDGVAARTLELGVGISFHGASDGELGFRLRDSDGNTLAEYTDGSTFNDGSDYHLLLNKVSNSAGGIEFYVNDMDNEVASSNDADGGFGNATVQNFDGSMGYFCRSQSGDAGIQIAATKGNIRWFNDSLNQSQRQAVHDSLPWT